jgi:hypothetical protein
MVGTMLRRIRRNRLRALLAILLAALGSLMAAPASQAGHGHNNPPCWGNGLGDGYNSNYYVQPIISYQGDASCGYHALAPNMSISLWWHPGPAGIGGFDRLWVGQCGYAYYCSQGFNLGYAECKYRAGIQAISALDHHWHDHHYTCAFL